MARPSHLRLHPRGHTSPGPHGIVWAEVDHLAPLRGPESGGGKRRRRQARLPGGRRWRMRSSMSAQAAIPPGRRGLGVIGAKVRLAGGAGRSSRVRLSLVRSTVAVDRAHGLHLGAQEAICPWRRTYIAGEISPFLMRLGRCRRTSAAGGRHRRAVGFLAAARPASSPPYHLAAWYNRWSLREDSPGQEGCGW